MRRKTRPPGGAPSSSRRPRWPRRPRQPPGCGKPPPAVRRSHAPSRACRRCRARRPRGRSRPGLQGWIVRWGASWRSATVRRSCRGQTAGPGRAARRRKRRWQDHRPQPWQRPPRRPLSRSGARTARGPPWAWSDGRSRRTAVAVSPVPGTLRLRNPARYIWNVLARRCVTSACPPIVRSRAAWPPATSAPMRRLSTRCPAGAPSSPDEAPDGWATRHPTGPCPDAEGNEHDR